VARWDELDRELKRAIAHRKLATLDIRAGMFGTPSRAAGTAGWGCARYTATPPPNAATLPITANTASWR
jgi:hypothetical protein